MKSEEVYLDSQSMDDYHVMLKDRNDLFQTAKILTNLIVIWDEQELFPDSE